MEIDVKKEQERVKEEIRQLGDQINRITGDITLLQQQRQDAVNNLYMKQGEEKLLKRLNSDKDK